MLEQNTPQSSYQVDTSPKLQIITLHFTLPGYEPINLKVIISRLTQVRDYKIKFGIITISHTVHDVIMVKHYKHFNHLFFGN